MRGSWAILGLALLVGGCSTLSDREMLLRAGAFSVVQIPVLSSNHEPLGASMVTVDPGTHVVYVGGDRSDELAMVDPLVAQLVDYARTRPGDSGGGPPEGMISTPFGGAVFVRLPDYDGVPVMRYIGGEPSYVLAADAVQADDDGSADALPRRLMIASDEAGLVLLADRTWEGIGFQCLVIDANPTIICPDPIEDEFPVDMVFSPRFSRVFLLSAPNVYSSRLRAFGAFGEEWSVDFPGSASRGQILVDEKRGWIYVIQQDIAAVHRVPREGGEPEALWVEAGPVEMVQDRESGRLYVACRDAHSVVMLDPETGDRESLEMSESPAGLSIDGDAGYLFVAMREGPDMAVVDLAHHYIAEVDVSGPQLDITLDPDYRFVFLVIDGETLSRVVY